MRGILSLLLLCALLAAPALGQAPPPAAASVLAAQQWADKARLLWDGQRFTDAALAIAHLTEALRLNPRFISAFVGRGIAFGGLGQHERAIEDLTEALKINPKLAAAYTARGDSYNALGKQVNAIAEWRRACDLSLDFRCRVSDAGMIRDKH